MIGRLQHQILLTRKSNMDKGFAQADLARSNGLLAASLNDIY